ncbi:MAG: hypothetical protein NNA20_06045 [Nitrospira sp.]|nr:hypothetical protein [Nitrospira sp.]MCP9442137.1 hypothetical protein [Nitrospira sp.]
MLIIEGLARSMTGRDHSIAVPSPSTVVVMVTIIEGETGGTVCTWHKLRMCVRKTGGKIGGSTEEKIVVKIDERIAKETDKKIGRWIGAWIAEKITDRTQAANFVALTGPIRLPVNMAEKGETMPA